MLEKPGRSPAYNEIGYVRRLRNTSTRLHVVTVRLVVIAWGLRMTRTRERDAQRDTINADWDTCTKSGKQAKGAIVKL